MKAEAISNEGDASLAPAKPDKQPRRCNDVSTHRGALRHKFQLPWPPWSIRYGRAGVGGGGLLAALLSIVAFAGFAADSTFGAQDATLLNHWAELVGAAGLALGALMLNTRYRRKLSEQLRALGQQGDRERELAEREARLAQHEALAAQLAALRNSQAMLCAELRDREAAQRELAEQAAATRTIYDAALETIATNRLRDGIFLDVNQEFTRCYGYTREEVIGKSAAAIGLWRNRQQLKSFMAEVRSNGFVRNFAAELCAKDGRIVPILTSAVVVEINGNPCLVALARDITEPREAEREILAAREAALAASRAKSEFLSSMSHEIRTPMNAILGMAEVLGETPLNDEQRRFVEIMQNSGAALLDLIDGILDLAKVESGRLSLALTEFDLADLVERVGETLGIRAYEKHLELVNVIAPDLPRVLIGDPMRLRQILINLIGNAIKFTARGAIVVTVAGKPVLAPDQAGARRRWDLDFAVADTGIGIAATTLAELFAPFTQADSSTARKYGGSGLGLSIVRRLVELMGGAISVKSEPGRGSAFRFALSLEAPANEHGGAAIIAAGGASLRGKRILIADHNASNRFVLRQWAERREADVIQTADGSRTRAVIANAGQSGRPLDLVFIDCRMSGVDIFEIARERLAHAGPDQEGRPPATILMLTPDELGPRLSRMRELGISAARRCYYLVKPLKISEITRIAALAFDPGRAVSDPPPDVSGMRTMSASERPATPLRILVADDSPNNRMLIQAHLRHLPHQVDFAENGAVAIDRARAHPYQLILMDIQMPTVDGYAATRAIRDWESAQGYPPTRIIALTASALGDTVRRSLAAGCDAHIAKPVTKATLLAAVDDAVNSNAAAEQRRTSVSISRGKEAMRKLVVRIDRNLSDLIPGFMARKRQDVDAIRTAVDAGNHVALSELGHKIKGEGGSYGFDGISEIGTKLELAAKAQDPLEARRQADGLLEYLDSVEIIYE